jgi:hypothetical protein
MRTRSTVSVWLAIAALACVLGSVACSLVLKTDEEQCQTDADCKARGAGFEKTTCSDNKTCTTTGKKSDAGPAADPRFACADEPLASPDSDRQISFEISYTDFSSGETPTGLAVRLCASTDPTCANPRNSLEGDSVSVDGGGAGYVSPNADGVVKASVEYGFEGFLEMTSGTYAPTYRYTSPPLRENDTLFDQILLRPAEIDFFADLITGTKGSYESAGHALVFVLAEDCQRAALAGVHFTVNVEDDVMVPFYVINTSPTTSVDRTDALGRAGFLNVPEGIVTFTAEMAETGERIGSTSIVVRAGAATTVAVLPSP